MAPAPLLDNGSTPVGPTTTTTTSVPLISSESRHMPDDTGSNKNSIDELLVSVLNGVLDSNNSTVSPSSPSDGSAVTTDDINIFVDPTTKPPVVVTELVTTELPFTTNSTNTTTEPTIISVSTTTIATPISTSTVGNILSSTREPTLDVEDGDSTLLIVSCGAVLFVLFFVCVLVIYYYCRQRFMMKRDSQNGADHHLEANTTAVSYTPQPIPSVQKAVDYSGSSGNSPPPPPPQAYESPVVKSKSPGRQVLKRLKSRSRGAAQLRHYLRASKSSTSTDSRPTKPRLSTDTTITKKSSAPFLLMDKVTIRPEMFEKAAKKEIFFYKAPSFRE